MSYQLHITSAAEHDLIRAVDYIEKDSSVNEEIDRLRHSATSALSERRDVIVVSSVSCLYGLGDPIDYKSMVISLLRVTTIPMRIPHSE